MIELREIENRVLKFKPIKKSTFDLVKYVGGGQCKLKYLNFTAPDTKKLSEKKFSFSDLEIKEQFKIWQHCFLKSQIFEAKSLALIWLDGILKAEEADFLYSHWPQLEKWSLGVSNWAHSDGLCVIYASLLERDKKHQIYKSLKIWNQSQKPWLVRISLISLYGYARQRRIMPNPEFVERSLCNHWDFDHHYVQKAVGWTLREYATAEPQRGKRFIFKNVRNISPTAFTTAIERFSEIDRSRIKKLRNKNRN